MRLKLSFILFPALIACSLFSSESSAQEIIIIYTGETHAMVYPCSCPIEKDGGIARRAALVKQLREADPGLILLDSGGFSAGGMQDEYTLNAELDRERSAVNLKAMELMGYDAVAVGDEEFNFGVEFLRENAGKSNIAFLSANITGAEEFKPYIIKESAGKKIGIIGLSNIIAAQRAGAEGLEVIDAKQALEEAVSALKKDNADIIVLLSHMGESDDLRLLEGIEGINVVIVGHSRAGKDIFSKAGRTLILRPAWQGRSLGKLTIGLADSGEADYKIEELRLSEQIEDDPQILSILPACFSDKDCRREGSIGKCDTPGTVDSSCSFTKAKKVSLRVITPKECKICNTSGIENYLKSLFPGLSISYLYYPGEESVRLLNDLGVNTLPVYLLGKEAERQEAFVKLKGNITEKDDFYMLNSRFTGIAYYADRKPVKGKLDFFIGLYDNNSQVLLDNIKEFNPVVHFLSAEKDNGDFESKNGNMETEEHLRSVCVSKYYPREFMDYIICRGKTPDSSYWQDCLGKKNTVKINACARGEEGKKLLRENISLNKELKIMHGPTYLLNNREIFSSHGAPGKEELKNIMER